MLIEQPDQDHGWTDLLRAGMEAGYWAITSPKSLQRSGSRIREKLPPELKGRWQQGETGARWHQS
jgi:hypothetical protein